MIILVFSKMNNFIIYRGNYVEKFEEVPNHENIQVSGEAVFHLQNLLHEEYHALII